MHARVSLLQGSPDAIEEGVRVLREQVFPRAQELDGFKGLIQLGDSSSGKSLTITLWETEEALRASEKAANQLRDNAAEALASAIQAVDRYEVLIFEV